MTMPWPTIVLANYYTDGSGFPMFVLRRLRPVTLFGCFAHENRHPCLLADVVRYAFEQLITPTTPENEKGKQ